MDMRSVHDLMRLDGRSALVTGGAGHIGLAVCEALMELGAGVAVSDIDADACRKRCHALNQQMNGNGQTVPVCADLSKEEEIRKAVLEAASHFGGLDILVHSAAFVGTTSYPGWAVPFERQSLDAWNVAMGINLASAFVLSQAAAPYLKRSPGASIIFISSIYGLVGPDNRLYHGTGMVTPAAYSASKAGLIQLSRHLGTIFASENIRVNAVTAGGVDRNQPESFRGRYIDQTPLKRMAIEEDFKGAIAYLSSDLSAYVTGTNLIVDGGWTAL